MVGRADDLGRLREAMARVALGSPTAILVSGEAGIGKTRLVNEFLAEAEESVRVCQGGCLPLADGLLPYGPVVEMLQVFDQSQFDDPVLRRFWSDLAEAPDAPVRPRSD